jgi:hypothetical protein
MVALPRMEGDTNEEVADRTDCRPPAATGELELIRGT